MVPCQLLLAEDIGDYLHVLATVDFRLLHLSAFSHASSPGTAEPHCSLRGTSFINLVSRCSGVKVLITYIVVSLFCNVKVLNFLNIDFQNLSWDPASMKVYEVQSWGQ